MIRAFLTIGLLSLPASATAETAPATDVVIERSQQAEALCRADAEDAWAWCEVHDALRAVLEKRGWCFGKEGEPSDRHAWHRCQQTSYWPTSARDVACPQEVAIYRQLNSMPGGTGVMLEFFPPERGGLYDIVLRKEPESEPLARFTMDTSANMEFIFLQELEAILGIDVKPSGSIEMSVPRPPGQPAVQYLWIEDLTSWGWRVYPSQSETGEELSINETWELVGCRPAGP